MPGTKKSALVFVSAVVGAAVAFAPPPAAQAALTTVHLSSEERLSELLAPARISLVAEGRIGDLAEVASFELELGRTPADPAATAQHGWRSGVPEPFALDYDAAAGRAIFALGSTALEFVPSGAMNDAFICARATEAGSRVRVNHLALDGVPIDDGASATGPNALDILWISGGALADGFRLTGLVTLAWHQPAPVQSRLGFQILLGDAQHGGTVATNPTTWGSIKAIYR